MRILVLSLCLLVPASVQGQDSPPTPEEFRARLVTVFQSFMHRPLPEGDTLVTWSPTPRLLSTVHSSADRVYSSLVRPDGLNGTADVQWSNASPVSGRIIWTEPDSTQVDMSFQASGGTIVLTGTVDSVLVEPTEPWAVADYGMEDQLVPLISGLPDGESVVAVFRPFGVKWDLLSLTIERGPAGTDVWRRDWGTESPTFLWQISPAGALIRITRDDFPESERRPLEGSKLYDAYRRLVNRP